MNDESAALTYVRTRDPKVFRLLVERYHQRVFRLVASLLGPHADLDAEEVTQEVFIRMCSRLETFRGESKFGTWLFRLAFNRALEHRRHARITVPHVSMEAIEQLASDESTALLDEQRKRLVAGLLEELPDLYRTIINLRYWMDYSIEEIAEMLDTPSGTIKSYLFRARQQLRALAHERGVEFPE